MPYHTLWHGFWSVFSADQISQWNKQPEFFFARTSRYFFKKKPLRQFFSKKKKNPTRRWDWWLVQPQLVLIMCAARCPCPLFSTTHSCRDCDTCRFSHNWASQVNGYDEQLGISSRLVDLFEMPQAATQLLAGCRRHADASALALLVCSFGPNSSSN